MNTLLLKEENAFQTNDLQTVSILSVKSWRINNIKTKFQIVTDQRKGQRYFQISNRLNSTFYFPKKFAIIFCKKKRWCFGLERLVAITDDLNLDSRSHYITYNEISICGFLRGLMALNWSQRSFLHHDEDRGKRKRNSFQSAKIQNNNQRDGIKNSNKIFSMKTRKCVFCFGRETAFERLGTVVISRRISSFISCIFWKNKR